MLGPDGEETSEAGFEVEGIVERGDPGFGGGEIFLGPVGGQLAQVLGANVGGEFREEGGSGLRIVLADNVQGG